MIDVLTLHGGGALLLLLHEGGDGGAGALAPGGGRGHVVTMVRRVRVRETGHIRRTEHGARPPPAITAEIRQIKQIVVQ